MQVAGATAEVACFIGNCNAASAALDSSICNMILVLVGYCAYLILKLEVYVPLQSIAVCAPHQHHTAIRQ